MSVRRRDLDEALLLVPSVARIQKAHRRMGIQSGIAWRLMLSIPLGAFVGSAARYFGHVNWDHTPVIGAIAMAMFVEAAWRGVAEMRQMMVRLTCSD